MRGSDLYREAISLLEATIALEARRTVFWTQQLGSLAVNVSFNPFHPLCQGLGGLRCKGLPLLVERMYLTCKLATQPKE